MGTKPNASAPTVLSVLTVRSQLRNILRRASEHDERFVIGQPGEPEAVIMGINDFLRTIAPETAVLSQIRSAALKSGKSSLSMREINQEIRASRKERKLRDAKSRRRS